MTETIQQLAGMKKGQKGVIDSFTDFDLSLKLLEMGCVPGETIEVIRIAPLGDPIAISVSGYILGLRKSEAQTIRVRTEQ